MKYTIEYAKFFEWKSIEHIPLSEMYIIKEAIEQKLSMAPEIFGKPLRHSMKGCRRLRVGMYRIIFVIKGKSVIITHIAHRSKIYKEY